MSEASDPTQSQAGQTQPGWYPDPTNGQLRWWDGQTWGAYQQGAAPTPAAAPMGAAAGTTDPKQTAMWAHWSGAGLLLILCGFSWVGPMVILSSSGAKDPFIKDQATEALNFQITATIAAIISGILIFAFIGIFLLPVVMLGGAILGFLGGQAASRGEWYRYPFALRLVKGA